MSWRNHRRSNLSIQATLNLLEEEGLNPADCLEGTGLKAADILNANHTIPDNVEIEVTTKALTMLPPRAGYGVRAGQTLRITSLGVWGLAMLASSSIRETFQTMSQMAEFSFLLSNVKLHERGDKAVFALDMTALPENIHRFIFERYYAGSTTFLRELMPGIDLRAVELHLPFHDETYARQLEQITGRKVISQQGEYAVTFDRAWLDAPLPQADPLAFAYFVSQCRSLLNQHKKLDNYSELVRDHVIQNLQVKPRLDDVAAEMGLSPRSLRRRLEEEETTFTLLVLETKMTLAKELLATPGLAVKNVAYKLGYSEAASFSRAYQQWWGASPRSSVNTLSN